MKHDEAWWWMRKNITALYAFPTDFLRNSLTWQCWFWLWRPEILSPRLGPHGTQMYSVSKHDFWCFCLIFPRQICVPHGTMGLGVFKEALVGSLELTFQYILCLEAPCRMTLRPGWTGLEDRVMRSFGNQGLEMSKKVLYQLFIFFLTNLILNVLPLV